MMELNVPIRIYWDLPAAPGAPSFDHLALCNELVAMQVLMLHLCQPGEEISAAAAEIMERLAKERIAVNLTLSAGALARSLSLVERLKVKSLLVAVEGIDEVAGVAPSLWQLATPTGVSLPLDSRSCRDIPGVIRFCVERGIRELQFPIGRGGAGKELFFLDSQERDLLAAAVRDMEIPASLRLTIHDPFLWKIFYPEKAFPEGGCQAANSMLFVAPDGEVLPCPALPFSLGNVAESTLGEIARSLRKRELRHALRRVPEECVSCDALPQCHGGCRGRGYAARHSFESADPGCTPSPPCPSP